MLGDAVQESDRLERVTAGEEQKQWLSAVYALIALLIGLPVAVLSAVIAVAAVVTLFVPGFWGDMKPWALFFIFLLSCSMLALYVWMIRRVGFAEESWRTGPKGLTILRTFGGRMIPWSDVRAVRMVLGPTGRSWALELPRGTYVLPPEATEEPDLPASVCMHVRRLGRLVEEPSVSVNVPYLGDDARYVPELEVVQVGGGGESSVVRLLIALWIGMMALGLGSNAWEWLGGSLVGKALATVVIGLILFVYVLLITSMFFSDDYVRSDPAGLVVRRGIGRWFVRWEDVEQASVKQGPGGAELLSIRACGRDFDLSPEACSQLGLMASVWQHLRSCGKPVDVPGTDAVISLFRPLPEGLPEEMVWVPAAHERRDYPTRVEITRKELRAEYPNRAMSVAWNDVALAGWGAPDDGSRGLFVVNSEEEGVVVPVDLSDPECVKLLFAVIGRLRTVRRPQWLEVPEELFNSLRGHRGSDPN